MVDDIYLESVFSYGLYLAVDIPLISGIDSTHLRSPLLTLASFEGVDTDLYAPAWTSMVPRQRFEFRQPRGAIAELFAALAFWQENYTVVCYFPFLFMYSHSEFSLHCLKRY
jgi:hypothetical protein